MTRVVALAVMIAGCGRLGFDERRTVDSATIDTPPPPSGLVGWWKLDEGSGTATADAIGNVAGNLQAGSVLLPSWVAGHTGNAVLFTGDGDDVSLGTPSTLANLPALTISAWVQPTTLAVVSQGRCVMDKGTGLSGWAFNLDDVAGGDLTFRNYFPTTEVSRTSVGGLLAAGVWSHVVATWDGSSFGTGIRLYVDGIETAYAATTNASGARPNDALVGLAINCINNSTFPGAIDDVQLYDRVLTPDEVTRL